MTDQERADRLAVMTALVEADDTIWLMGLSMWCGLLQTFVMQSPDPALNMKALDAVMAYLNQKIR